MDIQHGTDIQEVRDDVREALQTGSQRVELMYATRIDYENVLSAMREDGWRIVEEESHGENGGIIVVAE